MTDEPIEVKRKPRAGVVLSVRLTPEQADALMAIAEARQCRLSDVAREAIAHYVPLQGPFVTVSSVVDSLLRWDWIEYRMARQSGDADPERENGAK